jgi:hypothetical protein
VDKGKKREGWGQPFNKTFAKKIVHLSEMCEPCSPFIVAEHMATHNSPNGRVKQEEKPKKLLRKFDYYLDESDPDVIVLRREDGTFVGAFSAAGATREGLVTAAEEDYRDFLREHGFT